MATKISEKTKQFVKERAKNCCEYCACLFDFANQFFSVEHIIPKSKGGINSRSNLAYACQCCNGHKYNKTKGLDPVNNKMVALYNPRQDKWQEHFNWSEDFLFVEGISPAGRATVVTLNLNRNSLVNLRTVLFTFGEHPPKHFLKNQ